MDPDNRTNMVTSFRGWSWAFGTLFGVQHRFSWTLLVLLVMGLVNCVNAHRDDLVPVAIVVPFLACLLHAWGHLAALRAVGGSAQATNLYVLGDLTIMQVPLRWWASVLVPCGGLAASAALWLACVQLWSGLAMHDWRPSTFFVTGPSPWLPWPSLRPAAGDHWWSFALMSMAQCSYTLLLWNLVPNIMFDGARLWRGLLWPVLGLRRAIWTSIIGGLGFGIVTTIHALTLTQGGLMLMIFGVLIIFTSVTELRAMREGWDLVLELSPAQARQPREGLLAAVGSRMRARRHARIEREEEAEQVILDRLLAKVSEQGLPSLTAQERDTLTRISKKQKSRQRAS